MVVAACVAAVLLVGGTAAVLIGRGPAQPASLADAAVSVTTSPTAVPAEGDVATADPGEGSTWEETSGEGAPGDPVAPEPSTIAPAWSASNHGSTSWGGALSFSQGDSGAFTIEVDEPEEAVCSLPDGCAQPETGYRVVSVRVVMTNTADTTVKLWPGTLVLEEADGTRVLPFTGAAAGYTDDALPGAASLRPGEPIEGNLAFVAPDTDEEFSVQSLLCTECEDTAGWS